MPEWYPRPRTHPAAQIGSDLGMPRNQMARFFRVGIAAMESVQFQRGGKRIGLLPEMGFGRKS